MFACASNVGLNEETRHPEVSLEQCYERRASLFTNVWQCGILIYQMSGLWLGKKITDRKTSPMYIITRAQTDMQASMNYTPNFHRFLVKCRKLMCSAAVFKIRHSEVERREMRKHLAELKAALVEFLPTP